jgi:hypothetical protein
MGLDVPGLQPRLVGAPSLDHLDGLRCFRHPFRSAYRAQFQGDRLAGMVQAAARRRGIS